MLKEIFPAEPFASAWADEYCQRLQGARLAATSRRLFPLVCRLINPTLLRLIRPAAAVRSRPRLIRSPVPHLPDPFDSLRAARAHGRSDRHRRLLAQQSSTPPPHTGRHRRSAAIPAAAAAAAIHAPRRTTSASTSTRREGGVPVTDSADGGLRGARERRPPEGAGVRARRHQSCRAPVDAGRSRIPSVPAEQMAANPRNRVFAIFLDIPHVDVAGSHRIKEPLIRLLDRILGPDDLVAVMTPEMTRVANHLRTQDRSHRRHAARQVVLGHPAIDPDMDERERDYDSCFPPTDFEMKAGQTRSVVAQEAHRPPARANGARLAA